MRVFAWSGALPFESRARRAPSADVLAPDLLGLGGPARRERGAELGDKCVRLARARRRQASEEDIDFGGESIGVLRVLALCPGQ